MKICKLEELAENDVVAKPVMTEDYQVLLSEGTILKKEYIEKLKEFYIYEVWIEEKELNREIFTKEKKILLKEKTNSLIMEKVKDILEQHTYQKNMELVALSQTADSIISEILEEEKVIERVFDIKQRNADIYEHSVSICTLATIVAIRMGLSKESIHDIGVGCLLHELGLRYINLNYVNKDIEELSKSEREEYKKHPVYGYSAISNESWLSGVSKQIILYHHERKNGSGYPMRVKDLSIECQIVAVCDVFDEMICGIGHPRAKIYEAVEYLKTGAVTFYDKEIIKLFLQFTAVYPIGSKVITNEGETAVVVKQNNKFPDRPVLQIIKDCNGNEITEELRIDLLHKNYIFIDKVLN